MEPNRIALPIEQDIVNIQTAFTVGTEPLLDCNPDKTEEGIFLALNQILKRNKIKYQIKDCPFMAGRTGMCRILVCGQR